MNTELSKPKTTILWGIDLFESLDLDLKPSQNFLKQWAQRLCLAGSDQTIRIVPALVMSASDFGDPKEELTAQNALLNWIHPKDFPKGTLLEPAILHTESDRPEALANRLYQKALTIDADLIVVTSHSRAGYSRWIKGSVSEELSLKSDIPTMVIGKNFRNSPPPESHPVLFATDLSQNSLEALKKLTPLLRQLRAQLHIYHALTLESSLAFAELSYAAIGSDTTGLATLSANDPWNCMRILETLRNEMIQEGIPCTYELDPQEGAVVDRVLQAAQRNQSAWIALAGLSSKQATQLWGSVSRDLARESPLPTWIMHSK
jgi:nucleotide-binding universal stress UspA family protein